MTEAQFERLTPYDDVLIRAARGEFYRIKEPQRQVMAAVYDELTGRSHSFARCGSCAGRQWVQRLARWYRNHKENRK